VKFYSEKLKNGLTVIGEERPSAVSSAVGFFVKTGARDETPEVAGVSHFLEHMMFKGTDKRSAIDINYELGAMGAQANAYTAEEKTVYYAAILPEYLPNAIELFSDMLRPKLDPGEFDTEKKVILEEIEMYHDRPTHVLFEHALAQHFRGHKAGNSVIGSLDSIRALSRDQMKTYFDARYSPSNMILAVAGNFSWKEVVSLAEKYCAHWDDYQTGRDVQPHKASQSRHVLKKKNMQRAHVCLLGSAPSTKERSRFASQVLSNALGDGGGSRLYWELIDKGLVDSASIDTEEMDGTGIILAYASTSPEQLEQVEGILTRILEEAKEVSAEELSRSRTKIGTHLVLQSESSMRRLMSIGLDWLERGEYLSANEEYAIIEGVDKASVDALLKDYSFKPDTVVRLLPEED